MLNDICGERGESIVKLRLTEVQHDGRPLFRPHFFGDKWPDLDFFVRLEGGGPQTSFFLVQVRSTRRGTTRDGRLRVAFKREAVIRLASFAVPVYFIGVDAIEERAYIVALADRTTGFSSITTAFPLDAVNRQALWEEVRDFWIRQDTFSKSVFFDPTWVRG